MELGESKEEAPKNPFVRHPAGEAKPLTVFNAFTDPSHKGQKRKLENGPEQPNAKAWKQL